MKCERCPREDAEPHPLVRRNFAAAGAVGVFIEEPPSAFLEIVWLCDGCARVEEDAL